MNEEEASSNNVVYVDFIRDDLVDVGGSMYCRPKNRQEYLRICKDALAAETYEEILCSIVDKEYFDRCEPEIQSIIYNYYSFPVRET